MAEAKSIDEAKDMRDKAEALRIYARQAKNLQLETDAAEIRIRAERRIGEMIAEQREIEGWHRAALAFVSFCIASRLGDNRCFIQTNFVLILSRLLFMATVPQ